MNNQKIGLIRASAGTGKSHTLLEIGKNCIEEKGYKEDEILLCTFSKAAADDLMTRFPYAGKYIGRTYHAIYLEEVKKLPEFEDLRVMRTGDYMEFSKKTKYNIIYKNDRLVYNRDAVLLSLYDLERHNKETFETEIIEKGVDVDDYEEFKETYEKFKKNHIKTNKKGISFPDPLLDFTDMILLYVKNCPPLPIRIALGDEVQDKTALLWKAWEHSVKNAKVVFLAGDDKQSLYNFMGSDVDYWINMRGDTNLTMKLTETKRSTPNVLEYADFFANKIRRKVDLGPTKTKKAWLPPYQPFLDTFKDYEKELFINLQKGKKFFFLTRNNIFLKMYKNWLMSLGLSFVLYNGGNIEKYPNPRARKNEIKNYTEYLSRVGEKNNIEQIEVTNIHQVKGREADLVLMLRNVQWPVLNTLSNNPDLENRVLYTAVTRAKDSFYFITGEDPGDLVKTPFFYDYEEIK